MRSGAVANRTYRVWGKHSITDNVSWDCIYNWIPVRQMVNKMPKKNVNAFDTAKDVHLCMKKVKGRGERPRP